MRNQLVRRGMDLTKNIAGSHRLLDVLREMSSVVSESKMFLLNESLDLNTKRLCSLQESNERAAGSLIILIVICSIVIYSSSSWRRGRSRRRGERERSAKTR